MRNTFISGELRLGRLVQYWDDGLRAGHIVALHTDTVSVQPIGAIKASYKPKNVRVPYEGLVIEEEL